MYIEKNHSPEYYRDKIQSLANLPTLPIIATEILRITREDKLSVNQILPIIEKDPPLTMKVLRIANSAYYGLRREIKSIRHAIVVIGLRELSNIAVSFSVIKELSIDFEGIHFQWKEFWKHSVACGYIAQLLAEELKFPTLSNVYILGLLHDIGKLVLYRIEPERYIESLENTNRKQCSSYLAEQEVFGITHSDIGKWTAEKWRMSDEIINTIGFHHNPDKVQNSEFKIYVSLIQVADMVCNFYNMNFGSEYIPSNPSEEAGWKILQDVFKDIKGIKFEEFIKKIENEVKTIMEVANLLQA
ncbi:MAG: hypothetical protein DRP89_08115 [Candidatus Neomarinimicrobiota bacterium]|nr:MAG: hypothetical protein DRP89_08115 [Candidatus Neomarinimicrobiota bacterium]